MDTTSARRLNNVWEYLMRMRVYGPRRDVVEDLNWLIEDYKRLDRIVEREFPNG